MTRTELTELLHRHVTDGEPTTSMPIDAVLASGRRSVRRRRLGGGVVLAAAAVAAVAVVPHAFGGGGHDSGIAPATQRALKNYDASAMPQLIDDHVHSALSGSVSDLGTGQFFATDEQGTKLPEKYYDKASAMTMQYDQGDQRFSVYLAHARSEAEGNARTICANELDEGLDFSCTVEKTDAGVATTTVSALLPLDGAEAGDVARWSYAAVTKTQVERGVTPKWLRNDPVGRSAMPKHFDPDDLWFERSVKVVHSQTFVTSTSELVRASSYAEAMKKFEVPADVLTTVSTDPELVIPEPPKGENGCGWLLHPEGISCNVQPEHD
jgi:hypothetical protein